MTSIVPPPSGFGDRPDRSRRRRRDERKRQASLRAVVQSLEPRMLLATFLVTNTADSGAGSLRQAIVDANAAGGAHDRLQHRCRSAQTITP
ncbi:MAG: hypothetical protein U0794_06970 [Isosphaeraceae bacterium]